MQQHEEEIQRVLWVNQENVIDITDSFCSWLPSFPCDTTVQTLIQKWVCPNIPEVVLPDFPINRDLHSNFQHFLEKKYPSIRVHYRQDLKPQIVRLCPRVQTVRISFPPKPEDAFFPTPLHVFPYPKIVFGMIILNGEISLPHPDMFKRCIQHVYPFAHEIWIVEGAVNDGNPYLGYITQSLRDGKITPEEAESMVFDMKIDIPGKGYTSWCTNTNGQSIDNTIPIIQSIPDPDKKINIVRTNMFWNDKTVMSNAWATRVDKDTEYVWQLDSDEFYTQSIIESIMLILLRAQSIQRPIDACFFKSRIFYGGWNKCLPIKSPACQHPWMRLFRHSQGSKWKTHAPPIYQDSDENIMNMGHIISHEQTECLGFYMFHYSHVSQNQMNIKKYYYQDSTVEHKQSEIYEGPHPEALHDIVSVPPPCSPLIQLDSFLNKDTFLKFLNKDTFLNKTLDT